MSNGDLCPLPIALLPAMIRRRQGHVVAISSIQGKISLPFRSACECFLLPSDAPAPTSIAVYPCCEDSRLLVQNSDTRGTLSTEHVGT